MFGIPFSPFLPYSIRLSAVKFNSKFYYTKTEVINYRNQNFQRSTPAQGESPLGNSKALFFKAFSNSQNLRSPQTAKESDIPSVK